MRSAYKIRYFWVALVLLPSSGLAAMIEVDNPGFEAQVHGPNTFIFGPPTDWDAYNTGAVSGSAIGTLNPETTTYFLPGQWGGSNVAIAYMQAGGTVDVEFGIRQTLDEALQPNTIYTLTVLVGNIASGESDLGGGGGPTFFDLDGFPGYRVGLLAGDTLLAADVNSLHSGGNEIPEGEFRTSELVFDSTGIDPLLLGQSLVLELVNLNRVDPQAPDAHREVDFDDIRLDAAPSAIVVPPSLALLVPSLFLLGSRLHARARG